MDFLNRAQAQVSDLFRSMTPGARITAALLLAVVLISLAYLFTYQVSGSEAYLMGGESFPPSHLGAMEAAFDKAGLSSYEFEGNKIRVPRGQQSRYMGALAGDFHRLLSNGGMFMYPAIVNHPSPEKNRPRGKLRLLYEANVAAFIAREAGGSAVDEEGRNILEIAPESPHQRTALYVGSTELVESIGERLRGR